MYCRKTDSEKDFRATVEVRHESKMTACHILGCYGGWLNLLTLLLSKSRHNVTRFYLIYLLSVIHKLMPAINKYHKGH